MSDIYEELKEEFITRFPDKDFQELENVMDLLMDDFETKKIDSKFNILICREKIHQLQENVFITISSDDFELQLEFENGINNGTRLNEYSFDVSLIPESRTQEVFKGIELDRVRVLNFADGKDTPLLWLKAEAMLSNHRAEIEKMVRNQSYDNYVTGGGTNKTDNYYRNFIEGLNQKGLFWQCIYEEVECDVNFK